MLKFGAVLKVLILINIIKVDCQSEPSSPEEFEELTESAKSYILQKFNEMKLSLKPHTLKDLYEVLLRTRLSNKGVSVEQCFCGSKTELKVSSDYDPNYHPERLNTFAKTWMEVEAHNKKYKKKEVSYSMKVNSMAVLSYEEKLQRMNGLKDVESDQLYKEAKKKPKAEKVSGKKAKRSISLTPEDLDYRKLGYVTEIVDQGFLCSSCYAFSALGAVEGAIFKKFGRLVKLSDQNIIDCNKNIETGNFGCDGGWMSAVFEYMIGNNGTEAASTYSLGEIQNACRFNSSRTSVFLKGYGYITDDEEDIKEALNRIGPLSAGINGGIDPFYYYGSGIFDDQNCNDKLNHAVVIVGYGTDHSYTPPKDYWILKNSWGTFWGESGYMRMIRGKNMCGIKKYVLYAEV